MYKVRKYLFISIFSLFCIDNFALGSSIRPIIELLLLDISPAQNGCNPNIDSDGDRLSDCFETNTGVFVDKGNTGTDPQNPDTDGDGIGDGDEVLGTLAGLRLDLLGTNPLRKNILIEYDWFTDSNECGAHSHRPRIAMINRIASAFSKSPLKNPDGSTGIYLIQDYGQGGPFTGGNRIADSDGVLVGGIRGTEFFTHKLANFQANRKGYFHYVLLPHRYNTYSYSSGQAELPGDDSIVSLYCFYDNISFVSSTIMHELGHNLNLRHGGNVECNYKPNYNSVMNYRYQFSGIDKNASCDARGDDLLSYSRGGRIDLNENALNENLGVCGNRPIDWNFDNAFSSRVSVDLNSEALTQTRDCGGMMTTLKDHNDWRNLVFLSPASEARLRMVIQEIITDTNFPK